MKNTNKRKGFTLVELLVVIAILAILATVSVVGYTSFITKARKSNAETEAAQIRELIMADLVAGEEKYYLTKNTTGSYAYIESDGANGYKVTTVAGDENNAPTSVTETSANADLAEILTGGKTITFANGGNYLVYNYVDDETTLYVKIEFDMSADLTASETEIS